ncbi:hypothetical protein Pint_15151 [Pistacia integerrima]|uniref:Uncharacterized protein n=1 Tax=Pistacia integerrima TaxID=434235 RepID=A0ACC0ZF83_9ROSI|nr:hypothetical protein Pint_15151 [Pistacia integerrima]
MLAIAVTLCLLWRDGSGPLSVR